MSTTTVTPETPSAPAQEPAATPTPTPAEVTPAQAKADADAARAAGDDLAAIKAEARKWEAQAKANAEAAKKLADIEEANKTEAQKAADRTAALEAKVKEYETREQVAVWKAEVSSETGVPAAALAGSTREEIAAHAEVLKPLIGTAATPAAQPVPTIAQTPARTPGNVPLKDQIAAAEASGDKDLVKTLKAMQLGTS